MTDNVNDKLQKQKIENSVKTNNKKNCKAFVSKFQANTISYRSCAWLIIKAY